MFKNLQKYLLIKHPLLWNLKIVPLAMVTFAFHIMFFIIGYTNGVIDFTETEDNYYLHSDDSVVVFFSVLISLLTAIIWIVFYFKNNAYKSFYPKKKFSLFIEWTMLLLGGLLLSSYMLTFFYAKDVKARSYFSKKEAMKRCETLAIGSFFIDGSYDFNEYITVDSASVTKNVPLDTFNYRGRKYHVNSLVNKNIREFDFTSHKQDSLLKVRIKDWLVHDQKDSVRMALQDYLKIAKEHHRQGNITAEEWTDLVYDYPNFMRYKKIGIEERTYFNQNEYDYEEVRTQIDTANEYLKTIGKDQFKYNKHYVPAAELNYGYKRIAKSWVNPTVNSEMALVFIYIALAFSIVIFSFRVTSGKHWLIALISYGVLNMLVGMVSAFFDTEKLYLVFSTFIAFAIIIYFFTVVALHKGKSISGVTLNVLLWILPVFLPITYYSVIEISKRLCGYYDETIDYVYRSRLFPTITMLDDSYKLIFQINAAFIVIAMLYLSIVIKKWKGIAES